MVLGPGLGRTKGAAAFARRVAREVQVPLLIDADGLNAHAGRLADLRAPRCSDGAHTARGRAGAAARARQGRDRRAPSRVRARGGAS